MTKRVRRKCVECGKTTTAVDFVTGERVCPTCRTSLPKYKVITKTRAKKDYHLGDAELQTLPCLERRNPHYSSAEKMKLYRLSQVEELAASMQASTDRRP